MAVRGHRSPLKFHPRNEIIHAFQKKSPNRIRTAQLDIDMVERRLKIAQQDHQGRHGKAKE
jgi:phage-related protein